MDVLRSAFFHLAIENKQPTLISLEENSFAQEQEDT